MDGSRAGSGVLVMRDGSRYIGDFHNGTPDGYGVNICSYSIKFAGISNAGSYYVVLRSRLTLMARSILDNSKFL